MSPAIIFAASSTCWSAQHFFYPDLGPLRQLVHGGRLVRLDLADSGLRAANPDHQLYRLDLYSGKVPYQVGDRIKIGEATGDVIDVGYLDTTLWEFGGQYLSTDHPSGRIIKFPNSNVLVVRLQLFLVAVSVYLERSQISDRLPERSRIRRRRMQEAAEEEVGEVMMERVRTFRDLLAQTPVDQLEVRTPVGRLPGQRQHLDRGDCPLSGGTEKRRPS